LRNRPDGGLPVDVLKDKWLDACTVLVTVTYGPKIDDLPIAQALRRGCFYVGARHHSFRSSTWIGVRLF